MSALVAERSTAPLTRRRRDDAPIIVAVDGSSSGAAAVAAAIPIAERLGAPIVFVYVPNGPSSALGEPYYQRRLDAETASAKRALDDALADADRAGVTASGEVLDGRPARRLVEFADLRGARLLETGVAVPQERLAQGPAGRRPTRPRGRRDAYHPTRTRL